MDITSLQNPRVKHIVKLRDDKKQRLQNNLMLVEGFAEIQLALAAGHQPQTLISSPELTNLSISGLSAEILTVSRAVFEKMCYRDNPDGWLGIFPIPHTSLGDLTLSDAPLLIVAESIEKPGNLGAILRTADATHVDALLLCDPRVDLWNPNVVRASRGALFSVPVVECDSPAALRWLKSRNIHILAATPAADILYSAVDLREASAIAVGAEDVGLTNLWLDNADVRVKIPMLGKVNSLNVSVSAALIIYEAVRQRNFVRSN